SEAMSGRDKLRNPNLFIAPESGEIPLPVTDHARDRHRYLSDLDALRDFVSQNPGRIRELVRPPFEVQRGESSNVTNMKMPPFIPNSNANPLTLSTWQYDLLMSWADAIQSQPTTSTAPADLSLAAEKRRSKVLQRLGLRGGDGGEP